MSGQQAFIQPSAEKRSRWHQEKEVSTLKNMVQPRLPFMFPAANHVTATTKQSRNKI